MTFLVTATANRWVGGLVKNGPVKITVQADSADEAGERAGELLEAKGLGGVVVVGAVKA